MFILADVDLKGWVWWVRPSNCSPEVLLSLGFIAFLLYWGCSFVESLPCKLLCLRLLGFHWVILLDLLVGSKPCTFKTLNIFSGCCSQPVADSYIVFWSSAVMASVVPVVKSIELSTSMSCNSFRITRYGFYCTFILGYDISALPS